MANRFKGEYSLQVGDKAYTLRYGINSLVAISDRLGSKTIVELAQRLSPAELSFADLRVLLRAGLERHHPEVDDVAAGDMIDDLGGAGVLLQQVTAALASAFPERAEGDAGPNAERAAGSGTAS